MKKLLKQQSGEITATLENPKDLITFEPWATELYHGGGNHPRLKKERGAQGQRRLALKYAAALARSPLSDAQLVADRLRACAPGERCGSGICPSCTWATNRWFRNAAAAFAGNTTAMLFSTVQLTDWQAMPTYLEELDLDLQKGLLGDALEDAGLGGAPVFGAMDLSLNVWPATGSQRWSSHWALYSPDRDPAAFTDAITSVLPRHPRVKVPVKTKPIVRTPDIAYSYGFKNVFDRKQMSGTAGKPDKIIRPGDPDFDTLAINLDRIGIMPRFFTQACNFAGGLINFTA